MSEWKSRTGWYFGQAQSARDIGAAAYRQIPELIKRFYPSNAPREFRAAPSIVCRSEVEMLGVAAPRFAYRTRVRTRERLGFINCRRLSQLQRQLRDAAAEFWSGHHDENHAPSLSNDASNEVLKHLLDSSSPFAECILPKPDRFHDFYVISHDYSELFGEDDEIHGTPFVNAIPLGGGVCSQGACFMATLLQIAEASFVHGPAEITALLNAPNERSQLELKGMKYEDFLTYFRSPLVGLNSFCEFGKFTTKPVLTLHSQPSLAESGIDLLHALHCYIFSDVPVIATVSSAVYCKNILRHKRNGYDGATVQGGDKHCILLVGAGDKLGRQTMFLAHDPCLGAPWVELSIQELAESSIDSRGAVMIFPVLPRSVQMHLLSSPLESQNGNETGLFRLATLLQSGLAEKDFGESLRGLPIVDRRACRIPSFRLFNLSMWRDTSTSRDVGASATTEYPLEWLAQRFPKARWVWIQECAVMGARVPTTTLWIWNAESAIDTRKNRISDYLFAVATNEMSTRTDSWRILWKPSEENSTESAIATTTAIPTTLPPASQIELIPTSPNAPAVKALQRCLITSFLPNSMRLAQSVWPDNDSFGPVSCDLYGFMLPDRRFLSRFTPSTGTTRQSRSDAQDLRLHELLSQLGTHREGVIRLADQISKHYFSPSDIPIRAISSYIPEISKSSSLRSVQEARGALRMLCELALALKQLGHPISAIEVVAGSRVAGIDWHRLAADPSLESNAAITVEIESQQQALAWATDAIAEAVAPIKSRLVGQRIAIALEVEPGSLFVLGRLVDAETMLNWSRKHDLQDVLGINLDIGHFLMARCFQQDTTNWQELLRTLQSRIVHCHISCHSRKGHFGDGPLAENRIGTEEIELLRYYQEAFRVRDETSELPITGCISLELEAATSPDSITSSLRVLGQVLATQV